MPRQIQRYSKKRSGESEFRDISHHEIIVICAVDEGDWIIKNTTRLRDESLEKYKSIVKYFGDIKELKFDSKSCIQQFANHIGIPNNKSSTTLTSTSLK